MFTQLKNHTNHINKHQRKFKCNKQLSLKKTAAHIIYFRIIPIRRIRLVNA